MQDVNCELLFEYLRSILYDTKIEALDIQKLDQAYQKLGMGLQFLHRSVEEMLQYTADLSCGNLSGPAPSRDNFLCVNLKNLHANLKHLTWQAKQVAQGDYSQKVSYLGEFSESFNTMTEQLREREERLLLEAEKNRKRAEVIEGNMELFVELTRKRKEWILVVDTQTREVLYCNKWKYIEEAGHTCENCEYRLSFHNEILNRSIEEQGKGWIWNDGVHYYRCTTFCMEWKGRNAHAHIVMDITDDEQSRQKLTDMAYHDPGTGIGNRRFFMEYMQLLLDEKQDVTLCYMDLDGLKYVNDCYGHNEGDCYIDSFVAAIRKSFRNTDIFARIGGDEFCVAVQGKCRERASKKLAEILEDFSAANTQAYPVSFSYGVVEIDGKQERYDLEEIIHQADEAMYECKRKNRLKYPR